MKASWIGAFRGILLFTFCSITAACQPLHPRAAAMATDVNSWPGAAHETGRSPDTAMSTQGNVSIRASLNATTSNHEATLLLNAVERALAPDALHAPSDTIIHVTVPIGWHVLTTVSNAGTHSIMLVPYSQSVREGRLPPGVVGVGKKGPTQTILFKARTPGQYAIVCTTPGHQEGTLALVSVTAENIPPQLQSTAQLNKGAGQRSPFAQP